MISKKSIIGVIIFLIIDIALLVAGIYLESYGWANYLLATASGGIILKYIGIVITILAVISCIVVLVRSKSKG